MMALFGIGSALKLVAGIGGAVTLMSMLSCAVDRIGSRAAAEAELAMTRAAAAEERRVAGIADRARIEAEDAQRELLIQWERDRRAAGTALAQARAAADAPRAPGECPARCRLPAALIEAIETQGAAE